MNAACVCDDKNNHFLAYVFDDVIQSFVYVTVIVREIFLFIGGKNPFQMVHAHAERKILYHAVSVVDGAYVVTVVSC